MRARRIGALLACLVTLAIVLSGCTAPVLVEGTSVTVAASQSFFSYNPKTSYGNSVANSSIVSATNSQFNYYDSVPKLVTTSHSAATSWSRATRSPSSTRSGMASSWSDGTPVDAADLLLAWAANSGA